MIEVGCGWSFVLLSNGNVTSDDELHVNAQGEVLSILFVWLDVAVAVNAVVGVCVGVVLQLLLLLLLFLL